MNDQTSTTVTDNEYPLLSSISEINDDTPTIDTEPKLLVENDSSKEILNKISSEENMCSCDKTNIKNLPTAKVSSTKELCEMDICPSVMSSQNSDSNILSSEKVTNGLFDDDHACPNGIVTFLSDKAVVLPQTSCSFASKAEEEKDCCISSQTTNSNYIANKCLLKDDKSTLETNENVSNCNDNLQNNNLVDKESTNYLVDKPTELLSDTSETDTDSLVDEVYLVPKKPLFNGNINHNRSSLKRKAEDNVNEENPKRKRRTIQFEGVTVFYFPRSQGFTCVPSQGGSTLGMARRHFSIKSFSLTEHAVEQRRSHRDYLLRLRRQRNTQEVGKDVANGGSLCSSSEESEENSEDATTDDVSDSELDADSFFFLQPLPIRQRRALLRESGVRDIEPVERDDCKDIRISREMCGCQCQGHCSPQTCQCSIAGIKCQVDRHSFPCGCSRGGCMNPAGRIEFNPIRVRTHFLHTLMRMQIERCAASQPSQSLQAGGQWAPLPGVDASLTSTSCNAVNSNASAIMKPFFAQDHGMPLDVNNAQLQSCSVGIPSSSGGLCGGGMMSSFGRADAGVGHHDANFIFQQDDLPTSEGCSGGLFGGGVPSAPPYLTFPYSSVYQDFSRPPPPTGPKLNTFLADMLADLDPPTNGQGGMPSSGGGLLESLAELGAMQGGCAPFAPLQQMPSTSTAFPMTSTSRGLILQGPDGVSSERSFLGVPQSNFGIANEQCLERTSCVGSIPESTPHVDVCSSLTTTVDSLPPICLGIDASNQASICDSGGGGHSRIDLPSQVDSLTPLPVPGEETLPLTSKTDQNCDLDTETTKNSTDLILPNEISTKLETKVDLPPKIPTKAVQEYNLEPSKSDNTSPMPNSSQSFFSTLDSCQLTSDEILVNGSDSQSSQTDQETKRVESVSA